MYASGRKGRGDAGEDAPRASLICLGVSGDVELISRGSTRIHPLCTNNGKCLGARTCFVYGSSKKTCLCLNLHIGFLESLFCS